MHPVLLEFSMYGRDVTVKSYTFFLVLAAIVVVGAGTEIARRRGLNPRKSALCLLVGLFATAVSARLIHWLTNPSSFDSLRAVFSLDRTNLSAFAGLLLGIPVAALAARKLGIDVWRLADSSAPALALAIAIAKVGCFLNGCCFGVATHARWGVGVPAGSESHLAQIAAGSIGIFDAPLPVHPTQLYESVAALAGCLLALLLLKRSRVDGQAFLAFALWFSVFRWTSSRFLYVPPSSVAPDSFYPAIYTFVSAACILELTLLAMRKRRQQKSQ